MTCTGCSADQPVLGAQAESRERCGKRAERRISRAGDHGLRSRSVILGRDRLYAGRRKGGHHYRTESLCAGCRRTSRSGFPENAFGQLSRAACRARIWLIASDCAAVTVNGIACGRMPDVLPLHSECAARIFARLYGPPQQRGIG